MAVDRAPAVLVKAPALEAGRLRIGRGSLDLKIEPLFQHLPGERGPGLAARAAPLIWQRLSLDGAEDQNLWDLCHDFGGDDSLGLAGVRFAEPDLVQSWLHPMPAPDFSLEAACPTSPPPQLSAFPHDPTDWLWFRNTDHSGFASLDGTQGSGARIAHLDTGYDAGHATLPPRLRLDLQRNFVEARRPHDARDVSEGLWVQDGHGAGTIGLIGSVQYGGAPGAEVVPIRIADRVILFRSSALAKALDYIYGLRADPATRIDVVAMSMGGVASRAWAEAINRLYEAGIFVVTAAGNNKGNLPTRNIVFPARFRRVLAACGVMQDFAPYTDRPPHLLAGNAGPAGKMATAMAAYTPNVPWAIGGCGTMVKHGGEGTSCATPQIAAAAAAWIALNREALERLPQPWMQVEATRRALFASARPGHPDLGRGALKAADLMAEGVGLAADLQAEPSASAEFPILRVLLGLGISGPDERQAMLELEALQLSQSADIERLLPDPDVPPESLSRDAVRRLSEALADQPGASRTLRSALRLTSRSGRGDSRRDGPSQANGPGQSNGNPPGVPRTRDFLRDTAALHLQQAVAPPIAEPAHRRLRVYAFDPATSAAQETAAISVATLEVPWERDLRPGPVGEYLEVVDIDPSSDAAYAPIDLNHPHVLSQGGLAPTPADPRFHQQMVYAVAMKTIGHFERALGRTALWSPRISRPKGEIFVRRLRVHPHALRGENAFYSPERKALLFGYFPARSDWRGIKEGQLTFTCLSHDIIAHETTHALLDGLHPRYSEATNPDVLAFHEAFADLVAIFQHFTMPEVLAHQISLSRGDLGGVSPLVVLASEFGRATSRDGEFQSALRSAIDAQSNLDLRDLRGSADPLPIAVHERGARLLAAVFDAYLTLYRARQEDLVLLATAGSGVLPQGRLSEPLVKALACEASKLAGQLLTICIRALDYCPPLDVTFGDYLRALITADRDAVPDDPRGYRLALIGGFMKRGITPRNVQRLSPESVVWEAPPIPIHTAATVLARMNLGWNTREDREQSWKLSRDNARLLHAWLSGRPNPLWTASGLTTFADPDELTALGIYRVAGKYQVTRESLGETLSETIRVSPIEVHSVRPARRSGPDGQTRSDLVVEITQGWRGPDGLDRRGGCTVLFDLETFEARYLIRKRVGNIPAAEIQDEQARAQPHGLREAYFASASASEPFALLHDHD